MKKPKYSFIIPVYNGEKTLAGTLKSIEEQTLRDFEIIIVDNASDDKTAEIARGSSGQYIFCANRGRSKARNAGAARSKGEFLAFIDSDVELEKDWLKQIDRYLEIWPLDAVTTKLVPFHRDESLLNRYRYLNGAGKTKGTFLNVRHKKLNVLPLINTAACVFSRKSFNAVGGFDESLTRHEDLDLSLRLFSSGYLLGGTRQARASVKFKVDPNYPFSEPIGYLQRAFEVSRHSLWRYSLKNCVNYDFLYELFSKERKLGLFVFALGVELASLIGQLLHPHDAHPDQRWKIRGGPNSLRFSFIHRGRVFVLKKGRNFLFINQTVFLMFDPFTSKRIKERHKKALSQLLLKKNISSSTGNALLELGVFAALGR